MTSVCPYFQIHQPHRIGEFSVFAIDQPDPNYFADTQPGLGHNEQQLQKVARECYRPTTELLLELCRRHPEFSITMSFSGVVLDQLEAYAPETLQLFQELVATGQVELLAETYHHSLAFFFDRDEFAQQVNLHEQKIAEVFGQTPSVFRNTELAYNNEVGRWADQAGYKGVLAEGWEAVLGWRSPNFVYRPPEAEISMLLKNYRLSDDIAFRFSREDWEGWPLTADKFACWIVAHENNADVINLFMDYETFGEHQWADTGIFDFLESLPEHVLAYDNITFDTVSAAIAKYETQDTLDIPDTITWADLDRDLSAWLGNDMQQEAADKLYALKDLVLQTENRRLLQDWRRLQTSDHFYYMCTKWSDDGDVHAYFSPYDTPYDAYINYMNAVTDFEGRIKQIADSAVQTEGVETNTV